MPSAEVNNIYDGLTIGSKIYNKTVLKRLLNYKIEPQYATRSKTITGSAFIAKTHFLNRNLYQIKYGIGGSYVSYAEDLFVRKITPTLSFSFRDNNDLRSNKRKRLNLKYTSINRDRDINNTFTSTEPNYDIFSARFINSNNNLINFNVWFADFQITKSFSKLAFSYEYRHLFKNNRQINLRTYSGLFLYNNTASDADFFSFALDRPTDYLFEYNYLGRSEDSGLFSQQYIDAEGGFKSQLNPAFANQWITTLNASTTLWKYILVYGDIGLVKNKFAPSKFVYDSGVRANLVTDFFEIYFPVYSNLGWEVAQANYDEKIRFRITLDLGTLLSLFRRRWY